MQGLMMDMPLLISDLIRHADRHHGSTEIVSKTVEDGDPVTTPANISRYQYGNHLGSVGMELDETGQLISYEEFHPYGTTAYRAANSAVDVSPSRYRYTGKERDEETGLGHHGVDPSGMHPDPARSHVDTFQGPGQFPPRGRRPADLDRCPGPPATFHAAGVGAMRQPAFSVQGLPLRQKALVTSQDEPIDEGR